MGIDKIAELAVKNDAVCKWHLGGYSRQCSSAVRQYLATAALAARPSESMLMELLEDDRFLLKHQQCLDVLHAEQRYLEQAPSHSMRQSLHC